MIKRYNINKNIFVIFSLFIIFTGCGSDNGGGDELSSEKEMTSFSFFDPAATGNIDESEHAITVTVPCNTDLTSLVALFETTGTGDH